MGLRARRAEPAAVDENEPGHGPRGGEDGFHDDPTSHAVADENGRGEFHLIEQGSNVPAMRLDAGMLHGAGRGTVTAEIDSDGFMTRRQMRDLGIPVAARTAESVHENEGRFASGRSCMLDHGHACVPRRLQRFLSGCSITSCDAWS
jgi:hypothetical protein